MTVIDGVGCRVVREAVGDLVPDFVLECVAVLERVCDTVTVPERD